MTSETKKEEKRLIYLAKKFKIFTDEDFRGFMNKYGDDKSVEIYQIKGHDGSILALKWFFLPNEKRKRVGVKVSISEKLFTSMLIADPTKNKVYLQWMLTNFVRIIKNEDNIDAAIRFADEDLGIANKYLKLFESNKRKKKFREWAIKNEYRKWKLNNGDANISDWNELNYNPSDINQYKSLSQLFDAVDPFIEREPSNLEKAMNHFINIGEADIPYRDRNWTVFIPLSTDANVIFDNFAGWCTAKHGNTMFKRYVEGDKLPNGDNSIIYILIDNKMFTGESNTCYQIHFESDQIKDQSNDISNIDLYQEVLKHHEGVREYFRAELNDKIKLLNGDISNNKYIDYLISFGYSDTLFNYLDKDLPIIKLSGKNIPRLPDISKFKNADQLLLMGLKIETLHPSIGELRNLELLSLSNNNIQKLPKEIGNLKKLDFLNIKGNPIREIPNEISQLDSSNGGRLFRIGVNRDEIGDDNYQKLKKLLPNTYMDM